MTSQWDNAHSHGSYLEKKDCLDFAQLYMGYQLEGIESLTYRVCSLAYARS